MERLLKALDELDDVIAVLRQLCQRWSRPAPRASTTQPGGGSGERSGALDRLRDPLEPTRAG